MKEVDINTWNRKQHFEHFINLSNPFFGVTIPLDVTHAYHKSKKEGKSFFVRYLHDCMQAINKVENMRYRIRNNRVFDIETVHASATIMREDKTFGFSWIDFDENFEIFNHNFQKEKHRIQLHPDLYPPINGDNCIYCSAMPWFNFTSQSEPISGKLESIPKLSFSKVKTDNGNMIMNVAISVNHALVDGYHVGLFVELFQQNLNR